MLEFYKRLLAEFVRFRSVSTDENFKEEVEATASWLGNLFKENGFQTEIVEGYGNPIVVASYMQDPALSTCLVYGHYDVQPAGDQDNIWSNKAFKLEERNNRLYARGAVDNKGQVLLHMVTAFNLIAKNQLAYNLRFVIEGNEETSSENFPDFVRDHKEELSSDLVLISDGENNAEMPWIEAGFRGGFNFQITLRTADDELHSGLFGGVAPSASHELVRLLESFFGTGNEIAIEGFYDGVATNSVASLLLVDVNHRSFESLARVKGLQVSDETDIHTEIGLQPTIQITGILTGYNDRGYKNSIPPTAIAKINVRTVTGQDQAKIVKSIQEHIAKHLPDYVEYELDFSDPFPGMKLDLSNEFALAAIRSIAKVYGNIPKARYSGGGMPVAVSFASELNTPVLLVSLGNEDCAMHAANENIDLKYVELGLKFSEDFLGKQS